MGDKEGQDVKVEVMGGLLWALLCGLHTELYDKYWVMTQCEEGQ